MASQLLGRHGQGVIDAAVLRLSSIPVQESETISPNSTVSRKMRKAKLHAVLVVRWQLNLARILHDICVLAHDFALLLRSADWKFAPKLLLPN